MRKRIAPLLTWALAIGMSVHPAAGADPLAPVRGTNAANGADGTTSDTGNGTKGQAPTADGGSATADATVAPTKTRPNAWAIGGQGGTGGMGGGSGPTFNGKDGGPGSKGGPATATATLNGSNNSARADGGGGGSGGNGGAGGLKGDKKARGNGGDGGKGNVGGSANATATSTGGTARAEATGGKGGSGGNGGPGFGGTGGNGNDGNKGGIADARATTSTSIATASAKGGDGGKGGNGGNYNPLNGIIDATTGKGGNGGDGVKGTAIATDRGTGFFAGAVAQGGKGGSGGAGRVGGNGGNGGDAEAISRGGAIATASAKGGNGGNGGKGAGKTMGNRGNGGDATAKATANASGIIPAFATAKATGGAVSVTGGGLPKAGSANAEATANSARGPALATATATSGAIEKNTTGIPGNVTSKATANLNVVNGNAVNLGDVKQATATSASIGKALAGVAASGAIGGPAPVPAGLAGLQGSTLLSANPQLANVLAATANDPIVNSRLAIGSGGLVLGLMSMAGANSTDTSGATNTVTDTASFLIDTTQIAPGSDLLVGLLDSHLGSLGFDSLSFQVLENGSLAAGQTFDASSSGGGSSANQGVLSLAQGYFDDNVLDLGPIPSGSSGLLDVEFDLNLTTHEIGEGFQADLLFGVGAETSLMAMPEPSSITFISTALAAVATVCLARRRSVRPVCDRAPQAG